MPLATDVRFNRGVTTGQIVKKAIAAHGSPSYQEALSMLGKAVERDLRIVEEVEYPVSGQPTKRGANGCLPVEHPCSISNLKFRHAYRRRSVAAQQLPFALPEWTM
jgi:hypothetical protein